MASNWDVGRDGEALIRKYLTSIGCKYFQADIITKQDKQWNLLEVKHQEMFTAPPFDGHGLPKWQIDARLKFQKEKDVRAVLYIVDKTTGIIYRQFMDVLMRGRFIQTNGESPRIIFPIESYEVIHQP